METNRAHLKKGFIALMTAIIISIILVTLMLSTSTSSFSARGGSLDSELKAMSMHIAQSCGNLALLSVSQNYFYTPAPNGDNILVGSNTCTIVSVVHNRENTVTHQKTIKIQTRGTYTQAWSTIEIEASVKNPSFTNTTPSEPNISIISWKEI